MKKNEERNQKFFPMSLPYGTIACQVDDGEIFAVTQQLWPQIFPSMGDAEYHQTPRVRTKKLEGLWEKYQQIHHEKIVFYNSHREPIGWLLGDMEDYMTFYLRAYGLITEYRRKGIFTAFQKQFYNYLEDWGYERIAAHHQLNNRIAMIAQLKMGYQLTGIELDERFGPLAKMVYFVHPDRQQGYQAAFSFPAI
ncbi:MAG: GNAT family N-acetyltransferase [Chlamydiota bacterium]